MSTSDIDVSLKERIDCLLNSSQSKAAYSFPRAKRFKDAPKKDNCYSFHNLPEIRNKRGTCLGYGKKCDYDKIIGCGSNKLYSYPSTFDPNQHNSPAYTFGVSRPTKKSDDCSPGPKYYCPSKLCDGISSCVFGTSGVRKKIIRSSSQPGPGAYYNEKDHALSNSFNSKISTSASVVFSKSKRFPMNLKDHTPGPGEYKLPTLINETGIYHNSKYKSIPARSFLGSKNSYHRLNRSEISPGPGAYNCFSIFAGYNKPIK